MNETIRTLLDRRSCRRYKDEPVREDQLKQIIEAGMYAPSGMNRQSAIIVSVTDKEMRDRLSRLNGAVMNSDTDPFYGAPQLLVVLANKDIPTYLYDGSLVMGNLMNAAASLGVASCWIHRAKEVFASEEGKAILKELGIEGNYEGIGNCILGYSDEQPKEAAKRKENYVFYCE